MGRTGGSVPQVLLGGALADTLRSGRRRVQAGTRRRRQLDALPRGGIGLQATILETLLETAQPTAEPSENGDWGYTPMSQWGLDDDAA